MQIQNRVFLIVGGVSGIGCGNDANLRACCETVRVDGGIRMPSR